MSIREWMEANDVRSFNVTRMELSPGWRVYAVKDDGRDVGITVELEMPLSDEYILDRIVQQFGNQVQA